MNTAAKLSRSGRTNPFGKCDAEESASIHKHHRPLAVTKKPAKVSHLRRAA